MSGNPVIVNTSELVMRSIMAAYGAIVEGMSQGTSKEEEES